MDKYNLAIEMGSSNTVICKFYDGVVLKEPTVIAMQGEGEKRSVVAIGDAVKKMSVVPKQVQVVRPIENGVIVDMESAAIMLKKFLEKIDEIKFFKKPNILFLVPCGLTVEEKNDYRNLAYLLGISNVDVMPSVLASMIGLNINHSDNTTYMIANIGSNTDIAVVHNGKIIDGCTIDVGGSSIDRNIRQYILEHKDLDIDEFSCEKIKIDIGTLLTNDVRSMKICGNDSMGEYRELYIDSTEVYDILDSEYEHIVRVMDRLLSKCSSNSISDIVMKGIYLCGASSNMPGICDYFASRLNIVPVTLAENPHATTIIGAGNLLNNDILLSELIVLNRTDGE